MVLNFGKKSKSVRRRVPEMNRCVCVGLLLHVGYSRRSASFHLVTTYPCFHDLCQVINQNKIDLVAPSFFEEYTLHISVHSRIYLHSTSVSSALVVTKRNSRKTSDTIWLVGRSTAFRKGLTEINGKAHHIGVHHPETNTICRLLNHA